MKIQQLKSAIKKFRAADVSVIKDDAMRAKAQKLQAKQGGFTLLELLVVITLLATLATAALVAYEGIGENANATAAANNIVLSESSIRNFRAVEDAYPNQWDNLANLGGQTSGGAMDLLADDTKEFFGQYSVADTATDTVWQAVAASLNSVGINELQTLQSTSTFGPGNVPNLAFNESNPNATADPADELEFAEDGTATYDGGAVTAFSISTVPSLAPVDGAVLTAGCTAGTVDLSAKFDNTTPITDSSALNLINDALDADGCHLVVALGFGKDVPGTTLGSRVAFSQVPTVGSDDINPAENYARLIALYHLGSSDTDAGSTSITAGDIFAKPRLIGLVDPEGRNLDQVLAAANEGGLEDDD
jgi:prepilin-type N-terminal cleavage/methylation domain-containing protein